jgi:hypothetical protein
LKLELSGFELEVANVSGADLGKAKLSRAYLVMANFCEANLAGADFGGANPRVANLSRTATQIGVRQGLLRHSAAVKRTAKRRGGPNGRNGEGGTEPAERPEEAGGDKPAGGPPPQRFSAKMKLRAVSRLPTSAGAPLELVARELNVTAARLSEWRDRALLAAEAALNERDRDDRDEEIARLIGKVGEMTMETELLREKIARLEAGAPLARRRSRR